MIGSVVLPFETMKSNDSQSLPLLPETVVYQIFKFLSLPERKNACLVCKQWHRVSNRRRFAESESFFFSNVYEMDEVVQILDKCQRKMLNLKFDKRAFDEDSNVLWSRCGQRIQSLQFNSCNFPLDFGKRIFLACQNLNEFSSVECSVGYDDLDDWDHVPCIKSMLQIGDDVVIPNLRTLHLNSKCMAVKERDLHLISLAFPQLNDLSIYLHLREKNVIREFTNFTVLVNLLNNGLKNLEKLCINFPDESEPINFSSIPQFKCGRLKNVSMVLQPFILRGDSLNKMLHYKFWTSFDITNIRHEADAPDTSDIIRLLNENPLLEKLDLRIKFSTSSAFSDLFKTLVKSRLKSLKILWAAGLSLEEARLFIAAVAPLLEGLPFNNTVKHLSLYLSVEFNALFLQYFRNVLYLEMKAGDVNTIFKYQENLKSLKFWPLAIRTDELTVRRSIESLEFMDIRPLQLGIFTAYQFPNLKYLVIDDTEYFKRSLRREASIQPADHNVNEENDDTAPNHKDYKKEFDRKIHRLRLSIFRRSPHLEGIEFGSEGFLDLESCIFYLQSCLYFHQLRYVSFNCCSMYPVFFRHFNEKIDEETLERVVAKYFKRFPLIRGLWMDTSRINFFFYPNTDAKKYDHEVTFYDLDYDFDDSRASCRPDFYQLWRYKR